MKKEEIFFLSRDGKTKIHAVKWIPEGKPVCILQIVHGMAEYIERYERLASVLTRQGILVTGEDHLGHGKSVGENGIYGYFCAHDPATVVVRDVHRLKKMVQEQYPGVPYLLLGHSMGSFILRNYLSRYGSGIDGAIVMGTGMQPKAVLNAAKAVTKLQKAFLGDAHVSRLLDKMAFGSYQKKITDGVGSMDWLSRDKKEVQKYLDDPRCGFVFTVNGFETLFELIGRLHDPESINKIPKELPVLFVAGQEDPVGSYGKAVLEVAESFQNSGMTQVECKLYPGMRHELVNEIGREEVDADLLKWILNTAQVAGQSF